MSSNSHRAHTTPHQLKQGSLSLPHAKSRCRYTKDRNIECTHVHYSTFALKPKAAMVPCV
eukprot:839208-Amphidinium_carterae.2